MFNVVYIFQVTFLLKNYFACSSVTPLRQVQSCIVTNAILYLIVIFVSVLCN